MREPYSRAQIRQACSRTLRSLRRAAKISQENLALEAGVERAYLGALERGLHSPGLEMIFKLLPVLGVSFVDFAQELERALRNNRRNRH